MKNIVPAQEMVDQLYHQNLHSEFLLRLYPDLKIQNDGKNITYFASSVNYDCNEILFSKESIGTYVNIHTAFPFKQVQTSCNKCDGLLVVKSNPAKIPLVLEHEMVFSKEYMLYALNYEEVIKNTNFSNKTLSDIQMYILNNIEEHLKIKHKADIYYPQLRF